ncbi:MAG: hypothetical protein K2W96_26795 [Gemmataceae bacterium]|nr:hypothetical protein [Gemmataceae bacterium]
MQATKLIPVLLIGGLLLATGVFYFVPSLRPEFVSRWFRVAQGFSKATSAEDALDKFRKAIEKRNYDAAREYLTGDYLEQFNKGMERAKLLADSIDNARAALKARNVSSDKADLWLYWLDPFPAFKYEVKNKEGSTYARIHWADEAGRFKSIDMGSSSEFARNHAEVLHALLPVVSAVPADIEATVKEVDGSWKIDIAVDGRTKYGVFGRHVRDGVQALEKRAGNYSNAIDTSKNRLTDSTVKSDFEKELKSNLDKSKP